MTGLLESMSNVVDTTPVNSLISVDSMPNSINGERREGKDQEIDIWVFCLR